ncbi:BZ3500_MvSof-1268-A1-R1_Chr1-1g00861 [Microbotryum saponariae]|uniref:BZ3500_MvSof-1268-A1-R1_Chr1-1g00861 protein n=1 Tax=Microbotryum saponariae TaxID=289078 RepID=A0A2X0K9U5_9BASI|nr:BZ3500_MvSof-1268-A1-R1_Chr1-1g00861 [Microbotryum saponariae]SCZ92800.1 BZ3501_MvSof-1269-A2-R1_Chr1-1g00458 [Microbotryum saponariae]
MSGFDFNTLLRYAKKAFTFYKKFKSQQNQNQGQGGQQQQQQQQQQGGAWNNQQQSPYPPVHGQQQQQHGAWQQSQPQQEHHSGPYGAHDGPATVSSLASTPIATLAARRISATSLQQSTLPMPKRFVDMNGAPHPRLPREMVELIDMYILSFETTCRSLSAPRRSWSSLPGFGPLLSSSSRGPSRILLLAHPTARELKHAFPHTLFPLSLPSPLHQRSFSSFPPHLIRRHRRLRPPFRTPIELLNPNYVDRIPLPPRTSVFWLLPGFLRPAFRYLVALDRMEEQNQDMANAQNSYYVELRNKAIQEGDLMGKAFSASKQAYASGDGGRAHDLSVEGKEHQRLKEQYNDQAAQWIFDENNKVQPRGTIDLHGLYVQESIDFTERAIRNARQEGLPELRVIVGKGNHSAAHVAKIKPAITSLMQKENLTAHLDQRNSGVLVVLLQGQGTGKSSREVIGDLERDPNNDCVVM